MPHRHGRNVVDGGIALSPSSWRPRPSRRRRRAEGRPPLLPTQKHATTTLISRHRHVSRHRRRPCAATSAPFSLDMGVTQPTPYTAVRGGAKTPTGQIHQSNVRAQGRVKTGDVRGEPAGKSAGGMALITTCAPPPQPPTRAARCQSDATHGWSSHPIRAAQGVGVSCM